LFYESQNSAKDPIVLWLQGGPGCSSLFGCFVENGPTIIQPDGSFKANPFSWNTNSSIIYMDSPVGTGYSYVEDDSLFTTNEDQIAADLVEMMKAFLVKYDEFRNVPFYVFSESYGGKMTASFGKALNIAIKSKQIDLNFGGVALGDSWIDPMSFVNTWAPYLLTMAEIDENGFNAIMKAANDTQKAVDQKSWAQATDLWGQTENVVETVSAGVNFYNILDRQQDDQVSKFSNRHLAKLHEVLLAELMNGPIKRKLGIPSSVTWGGQANQVFQFLSVDFMQSVVDTVDYLLAENVKVVIYSGNLDLICCTIGTRLWMEDLKWGDYKNFKNAAYKPMTDANSVIVAFQKSHKNLHWYTILSAGHMVPADQPKTALMMLTDVFK